MVRHILFILFDKKPERAGHINEYVPRRRIVSDILSLDDLHDAFYKTRGCIVLRRTCKRRMKERGTRIIFVDERFERIAKRRHISAGERHADRIVRKYLRVHIVTRQHGLLKADGGKEHRPPVIAVAWCRIRQEECMDRGNRTLPRGTYQPLMEERNALPLICRDDALKRCRILLVHR